MKKLIILLMTAILLVSCGKKDEGSNNNIQEKVEVAEVEEKQEYEPLKISAKLEDYTIENVEDLKYYEDIFYKINDKAKNFLKENKFLVEEASSFQGFEIYETNEYLFIPSVVTSDIVLNMYHTLYDSVLRNAEENSLVKVQNLLENLYNDSSKMASEIKDEKLKEIANKNKAYFYLALKLSGRELPLDEEIGEIVKKEEENINSESPMESNLVDKVVDYSQFIVRGHYGQSEDLTKYFKTVMFLSQENIKPFDENGNINYESLAQGILMAKALENNTDNLKVYSEIKSKFDFLVESSEDIDMEVLLKISNNEKIKVEELLDKKSLEKIAKAIESLDAPKIKYYEGKTISFMPQKAVLDNVLMQNMVDTKRPSLRPIYSGVDLMAVLGNKYAEDIMLNDENNLKWEDFKDKYKETKSFEEGIKDNDYLKNLYRLHLFILKGFNDKNTEGYPSFMKNDPWKAKELNTQLASWAELKHDTLLYGKQVGAEMGGGEEKELRGYVEPQVEVYNRIIFALDKILDKLANENYLSEDYIANVKNYREMVKFFLDVSIKELQNEVLTEEEYERINYIGGEFENIFVKFYDENAEYFYEIEETAPSSQSVIADLMNVAPNSVGVPEGKYLEVGSGLSNIIYIVYEINGELCVGRGACSSYYEFLSDRRLTDDEFLKTLMDFDIDKNTMRPEFIKNFEIGKTYSY